MDFNFYRSYMHTRSYYNCMHCVNAVVTSTNKICTSTPFKKSYYRFFHLRKPNSHYRRFVCKRFLFISQLELNFE